MPSADALIHSRFPDFAARLDGSGPIGVAVSGGGDSVALLYALAEWNRRPLEVFCVDHGLNPASAQWTQSVADHAHKLNAGFTALHWTGDKPATGLSAAARLARHRLLAGAAREKGVRVLCLAHTAGDIAEAEAMRLQGSTVGTPRVWSPSPVWPEGRGVCLYRPFLDVTRDTLRDYLRDIGAGWIEDPANSHPGSLRARTRAQLETKAPSESLAESSVPPDRVRDLLSPPQDLAALGLIIFDAAVFQALPRGVALRLLSAAAVCAGGGDRLPKTARVEALCDRLEEGRPLTLAGARIQQAGEYILIAREAGDIGRNRPGVLDLVAKHEGVWDGRFVMEAAEAGKIIASAGVRRQLGVADQAAIAALPAVLRGTLPVWADLSQKDNQTLRLAANPLLRDTPCNPVRSTCLVLPRFRAATGLVSRESDVETAG